MVLLLMVVAVGRGRRAVGLQPVLRVVVAVVLGIFIRGTLLLLVSERGRSDWHGEVGIVLGGSVAG